MNQNLPSIFERRERRGLAETAATGLGGLMPPHVSILGGRFALVDAGGQRFPLQTMHLDCIIVDINPHVCKTYWGPDPFVPGREDNAPPLCFSDNGVGPSANSAEPQARTCAECELNAWGSATNEQTGKSRKACSDRRKVAVVVLNDQSGLCHQLQVPPASLKPFLKYSGQLQAMNAPGLDRRADMDDVVTRITFVDNKNGELSFQAIAWINSVQMTAMGLQLVTQQTAQGVQTALAPDGGAAAAGIIDGLLDRHVTDTIVNKNDRPWSGTLQVTQAAPQAQLAPPAEDRPVFDRTAFATQAQQRPAPAASTLPPPQPPSGTGGANDGRGGTRRGAGRPRKPQAAPQAFHPGVEAQQPVQQFQQEIIPPMQPMPMQAQPLHQQPATPEPLTGLQPQPASSGTSAFAQPQSLAADMDAALNVAMGLTTK